MDCEKQSSTGCVRSGLPGFLRVLGQGGTLEGGEGAPFAANLAVDGFSGIRAGAVVLGFVNARSGRCPWSFFVFLHFWSAWSR
jgi:hypothetical protein